METQQLHVKRKYLFFTPYEHFYWRGGGVLILSSKAIKVKPKPKESVKCKYKAQKTLIHLVYVDFQGRA